MSDQLKIEKIEKIIRLNDFDNEQTADNLISLALSIDDEEERDLMLEKIVVALARVGKYDKSQYLLNKIAGAYERTEGLIELAASLTSQAQAKEALVMLKQAEDSASQLRRLWQKAEMLNRIACGFLSLNEREEAIRILEQAISLARLGEKSDDIQDSVDSSSVLWDISKTLAQLGERDQALEVASSIKSPGKRENAIRQLG